MNNKLEIKKLNMMQVVKVYNQSLKYDFPANERRPLIIILKGMLTRTYECLGAFYKGRMLGYAFFLKHRNDYLWDYLAVFNKYRCKGVGTKVVQAIKEYYKAAHSVIGEVENPTFAKSRDRKELMTRRLDFYIRNGCIDTGVRTKTFGADFIIIQISGEKVDTARVAKLYQMHYKASLPRSVYDRNIKIYFDL